MEPFSGRQNKAYDILILCLSDLGLQAQNHKLSCKNKKTHTQTNIFHPKTFTAILDTPVVHILSHHQYQKSKTGRSMQEQNGRNTQSKHDNLHIPHSSKLLPSSFAFSSTVRMESSVL